MIDSLIISIKYIFILTYLVWGFVVAFETVLAMSGSKIALKWIRDRYSKRFFTLEVYAFYPIVLLFYIFYELLPFYLGITKNAFKFDLDFMFDKIFDEWGLINI